MATTRINGFQQFTTTGPVDFNNQRITNLGTPTENTDAVTKIYVDSLVQGLDIKGSTRVATTGNIALSGTQTIDGIGLSVGDRVLVKNQGNGTQNGIYVVSTGAWARASDANNITPINGDVTSGMFCYVEEGTLQANTGWALSTTGTIILDATALVFTQFSGAGTYIAGNGLYLTGNRFDIIPAGSGLDSQVGSTGRLKVTEDTLDLCLTTVAAGTYGDTVAGEYNIHKITVDGYGRITNAVNRDMFGVQAKNKIFASSPTTDSLYPTFRTLVLNDVLPGLVTTPITVAQGQLLIGNGTNFTQATLTQTTGISITVGSGSIQLGNTGVTSLLGTTNQITVNTAYTAVTGAITLAFPTTGVTLPAKTTLTAATATFASLNIPSGAAPTTPNTGDVWLITGTGLWGNYNGGTHTFADLDSVQTFTANKTLTNPTLATIGADPSATSALFLGSGNKMFTRSLVPGAFTTITFTGTENRLTITGTSLAPIFDISSSYVGQNTITTLGTISTGVWGPTATTIGVASGGTGQTSYTDGQLLIGNSTGNTLTKATLTQGNNISIVNGNGSITISATGSLQLSDCKFKQYLSITASPGGNTPPTWNSVIGGSTAPVFIYSDPIVLGSECIYVNGILQEGNGNDYTISGLTVTFQNLSIPQSGDKVLVNYIVA